MDTRTQLDTNGVQDLFSKTRQHAPKTSTGSRAATVKRLVATCFAFSIRWCRENDGATPTRLSHRVERSRRHDRFADRYGTEEELQTAIAGWLKKIIRKAGIRNCRPIFPRNLRCKRFAGQIQLPFSLDGRRACSRSVQIPNAFEHLTFTKGNSTPFINSARMTNPRTIPRKLCTSGCVIGVQPLIFLGNWVAEEC